jgi:hypothetical protein
MRSAWWFVLAGLVGIAGFVAGFLYLYPRLGEFDQRMTRVVMPGTATLQLKEAGDYTIYHEQKSVVEGRYYASATADGLQLALRGPGGGAVPLTEPKMTSSYSSGGRSGSSIFTFTAAEPGAYRLTGTLAGGRDEPKIVLAVEHGALGLLFSLVFGTLAFVFGGLGLAGVIVIATVVSRSRAKQAATRSP